ncbi:MAG: VWA domain-containing protein [Candidatus Borkfalkiaceae bacterium]|nr:VWA domain-containing protein [Christensenellaceae bacterium]
MTLLTPLGLLGLIGIIILIIIYIIKPNFQQKFISSTYVWKKSLNYRKRRLPSGRFKELLLILCQVLLISSCAIILAYPALESFQKETNNEAIVIVDASGSMMTVSEDLSRYEKAVDKTDAICKETLEKGGKVTIIKAEDTPKTLFLRADLSSANLYNDAILALREEGSCTYGQADLEAAMSVAKEVTDINPGATVYVVTDNSYLSVPEGVSIVDVKSEGEWNAGILSAEMRKVDGFYNTYVTIGLYGSENRTVPVSIVVNGVRNSTLSDGSGSSGSTSEGITVSLQTTVDCIAGRETSLILYSGTLSDDLTSNPETGIYYKSYAECGWETSSGGNNNLLIYEDATVTVGNNSDNYDVDDSYYIGGPTKKTLRIQYFSASRSFFIETFLEIARGYYEGVWELDISTVREANAYKTEGFDYYIFENHIPGVVPNDGAVVFINPPTTDRLDALGVSIGSIETVETENGTGASLTGETMSHPIMSNVSADKIFVTSFCPIQFVDAEDYSVLLSCQSKNVVAVKSSGATKLMFVSFPIENSTIALNPEFVTIFFNSIDYFLPATLDSNDCEVGEEVKINCRGKSVTIQSPSSTEAEEFAEFPVTKKFYIPNVYVITTVLYGGTEGAEKTETELLFVRASSAESNIFNEEITITSPFDGANYEDTITDYTVYFAAALVALLFFEWLLNLWQGA